jgi:uncharacterized membrane protein
MKPHFRSATWTIPLYYAVAAAVAGFLFPRIELGLFPRLSSDMTVGSATAIYSSVASGMLALTGVVFSLAFLMIQFSATAYSPRLVLWISRDPFLWHAVGVFIATFVYAIAALSWVDREPAKVPYGSTQLELALLFASVGMFIGLIQRIGLLQINRMLQFTGDQGRKVIQTTYQYLSELTPVTESEEFRALPITQTLTHRAGPQAIQALHAATLVRLAKSSNGVIEILAAVGDTVTDLTPVLQVFGASHPIDERALAKAIETGNERTFEQDPKYALRLLVDIAIRALSPAINDPTTAVQALDQIQDLLTRLGRRRLEIGQFRDEDGEVRLVVPYPTWEDFLQLAFDEILHYGAESVQVMRRMSALAGDLDSRLPEERRPALHHWELRLQVSIARSFEDVEERLAASIADRQGLGVSRRRTAKT